MDLKALLLWRGDALKLYYCGEAVHFRAVLLCGGMGHSGHSYGTLGKHVSDTPRTKLRVTRVKQECSTAVTRVSQ